MIRALWNNVGDAGVYILQNIFYPKTLEKTREAQKRVRYLKVPLDFHSRIINCTHQKSVLYIRNTTASTKEMLRDEHMRNSGWCIKYIHTQRLLWARRTSWGIHSRRRWRCWYYSVHHNAVVIAFRWRISQCQRHIDEEHNLFHGHPCIVNLRRTDSITVYGLFLLHQKNTGWLIPTFTNYSVFAVNMYVLY